jgi:TatD DNase family protein
MTVATRAPLFDTHCHLDDKRFRDDRAEVLARAQGSSVARMVTVGCCRGVDTVARARDLAHGEPDRLRATVGVHPHDAKRLDAKLQDAMRRVAEDPLVVAIGETGLDYHYDRSPRDAQQAAFRRQVALARDAKKPLVIHTREARADTLAILREEGAREVGGIIHCFSEDLEFAKASLDLGFFISFSGLVTYPGTDAIRDAARALPKDALLVETDAPYLAPEPHRRTRNEPAYVQRTATALAELRGDDEDDLRWTTTLNACRVFGLEPPSDASAG